MSDFPQQLTLTLEKHRNHYLFSDYYLDHLLRRRLDWQEATSEARAAMKRLQAIYAAFTPTPNEAQTERDWIRPALEALDHVFEVQPSIATPDGVRRPDYVFFPTKKARRAAKPLQGQEDYPATALAVGDAKHWDRSLDQTLTGDGRKPRDPFTNKNPSWQIYFYTLHTGVAWGILTNGRRWRLYHKDTAHKLNYYYEVDLPALLGNGDVEAFKYFYLFFRQASFIPNGEGRTWLDIILQESRDYAEGVGEDLKEQVYEALRHVAQGFLDYPGNGLAPDRDTLKAIYDNSLILLYRLLFILYAESRALLPVQENETYRLSYSLDAIKKEIERTLSKPILPTSRLYWPRLEELFGAINKGNEHLGVPAYNGDLFAPQKHPFLEQYVVGDQELRRAIDNLARTDTEEGRVFVDYRDLEVRHLGSIYEGLLEFHLEIGDWRLEGGKQGSQPPIHLVTDRGERKATGSYYTPDYIVKYIVEQTLKPLLDEILARWADRKNVTEEDLINDILSLNVLDPAMGSGHFLVEAMEHIARYLAGLGLEPPLPPQSWGERGAGAEAEMDYWKRRVVQSCIYGVDLNPLAVELAKLSLWLATVSPDKPLSFLDHHLRCGNSLIGARVADLGAAPVINKRRRQAKKKKEEAAGQLSMFENDAFRQSMMTAVDSMWLIEGTDSSTVEGVKEQERIYRKLREELTRRYRQLADLWTARYFGVVIELENQVVQTIESFRAQQQGLKGVAETKEVYSEQKRERSVDLLTVYRFLADAIQNGWADRLPRDLGQMMEDAQKIAGEKRFLHWELEFPEVFFDRFGRPLKGEAGFDVVVGNPPWVVTKPESHKQERIFFEKKFQSYEYQVDLYVLFIERVLHLGKKNGCASLITPNSWVSNLSTVQIRKTVFEHAHLISLVKTPPDAFEGVVADNLVFVATIKPYDLSVPIQILDLNKTRVQQTGALAVTREEIDEGVSLMISAPEAKKLIGKIEQVSVILDDLCETTRGVNPYDKYRGQSQEIIQNRAYHADHKKDKTFVPELRGRDVQRYSNEWDGRHWISYGPWLAAPREPKFHRGPRLLLREILGQTLIGLYIEQEWVTDRSLYIAKFEDSGVDGRYVCAICNGVLIGYYARVKSEQFDQFFPKIRLEHFRKLPIRRVAFTTPQEERERLVGEGITEATEWIEITEGSSASSVSFSAFSGSNLFRWLDARLTTAPEQSDVAHDLLAHLAEQMIAMNKEKQAEAKGFLDWLADYTGWPIDKWKLKTYVRAYWEHPWSELQRALRQNRKKMRQDVEGREAHEKVKGEFEDSMEKLQPLLARIAANDRLVDLIVYRMYNLTEDEVKVVEGERK